MSKDDDLNELNAIFSELPSATQSSLVGWGKTMLRGYEPQPPFSVRARFERFSNFALPYVINVFNQFALFGNTSIALIRAPHRSPIWRFVPVYFFISFAFLVAVAFNLVPPYSFNGNWVAVPFFISLCLACVRNRGGVIFAERYVAGMIVFVLGIIVTMISLAFFPHGSLQQLIVVLLGVAGLFTSILLFADCAVRITWEAVRP